MASESSESTSASASASSSDGGCPLPSRPPSPSEIGNLTRKLEVSRDKVNTLRAAWEESQENSLHHDDLLRHRNRTLRNRIETLNFKLQKIENDNDKMSVLVNDAGESLGINWNDEQWKLVDGRILDPLDTENRTTKDVDGMILDPLDTANKKTEAVDSAGATAGQCTSLGNENFTKWR